MSSAVETEFSARRRRRASMACLSCRKSRIRCKVEPGQDSCTQCAQTGSQCNFDSRDGRKNRANSKAVANELSKRIQHLEALLKQSGHGHVIPEAPIQHLQDSPTSQQDVHSHTHPMETDLESQSTPCYDGEPPPYTSDSQPSVPTAQSGAPTQESRAILGKLVPRPVKFDMASGRVRFFGPTTNMHILSRSTSDPSKTPESFWPISTLVRDLTPETHDYLIDLFFDCHNSSLHVVHKWAFFDDLRSGGTQFYSNFLHMTMLAEGYRYADRSRSDIKKLSTPSPDSSIFHTRAKKMAELELVKPGGVPSIQAFFLLGDLEVGCGRDDTGWMFSGMAFRLLFDVGLHVDPSELRLTEREVQIRHMVLWACIMNDVYWALYLGRPTMLKPSDIAPACLNKDFDRLILSQTRTYAYEKTIETKVYEAILQLMDLLEPLCETRDLRKGRSSDAYLKIASMDRRLNDWYNDLGEGLTWSSENVSRAPASFYLLHTQYHTALILLHRTFPAQNPPNQASSARHTGSTHHPALSRNVCVSNAVEVAQIIAQYRKRFPINRIFVTGLQHVGTAATALMAEVSMLQVEGKYQERKRLLGFLVDLKDAMREMSEMYQPAVLMGTVVEHFVRDSVGEEARPQNIDPTLGSSSKRPISISLTARPTRASTAGPPDTTASSSASIPLGVSSLLTASQTFPSVQPVQNSNNSRSFSTASPNFGFHGSSGGLPFLPSSWFEEMNWEEDTEFLNLMGLKDLQNAGLSSGGDLGEDFPFEGLGSMAGVSAGASGGGVSGLFD